MVLQKIKNWVFESKSKEHKESPVTPIHSDYHLNIIGGQSFQDADCIFGIVNITENISAAVIRLDPPGTHKKMMGAPGKPFKIDNSKGAILEISTEAKYDYKETGMWSRWPEPTTIHYSELKNNDEHPLNVSSEIPCKFILLESKN